MTLLYLSKTSTQIQSRTQNKSNWQSRARTESQETVGFERTQMTDFWAVGRLLLYCQNLEAPKKGVGPKYNNEMKLGDGLQEIFC
jgi:hypothetical protein